MQHVVARHGKDAPVDLYFDAGTGLLARLVRTVETPLGRLPTQVDYKDYRAAGGVTLPFAWSVSRPGNRFEIKIDDVQQNVTIDPARFARP